MSPDPLRMQQPCQNHGPLPLTDNTSTEEAHQLIDEAIVRHEEEIKRHEQSILVLKSQRNTFAPISRALPPDILHIIFTFVRDDNSEDLVEDEYWGDLMWNLVTWVAVTQVSHYWRSIANNSPSLWTRLSFRNLNWVKVMLRRSKEAGLIVHGNAMFPDPQVFEGIKLALQQSQRIRRLSIDSRGYLWDKLKEEWPQSAPQLESLCLSSAYGAPSLDPLYEMPVFTPEDVPSQAKLRSLELNYFVVNFDPKSSCFLQCLTQLKLCGSTPAPELTWNWLVDVMKEMPHLEVLDLHHSFPACPEDLVDYGSAHLSSLRSLSLGCESEEGRIFLNCIKIPPTTLVKIDCCANMHVIESASSINFTGIFMSLAQLYSRMTAPLKFRSLILHRPLVKLPGAGFKLFVNSLTDEEMLTHDDMTARLEFTYTWPSRYPLDEIATNAMTGLFNSELPLSSIEHVYLGDIHGYEPQMLADTLKSVKSIMVASSASKILGDVLQLVDPQSETPAFPNLSSLYFHGSRIRSSKYYYWQDFSEDLSEQLSVALLRHCLFKRSASGTSLKMLTFELCRKLYWQDIDLLGQFVDVINWDEEETLTDCTCDRDSDSSDSDSDDTDDTDDTDDDDDEWYDEDEESDEEED